MLDKYLTYFKVFSLLISYPQIVKTIITKENWVTKIESGRALQDNSVLGPFFALSPLCTTNFAIAREYFPNPYLMTQEELNQNTKIVRDKMQVIHEFLKDIVLRLLKTSPEAKEAVLQWFAAVLRTNTERIRLGGDYNSTATDGFMLNINAVLLLLSAPFFDTPNKINTTFIANYTRINIANDAKMNANAQEFKEFQQKQSIFLFFYFVFFSIFIFYFNFFFIFLYFYFYIIYLFLYYLFYFNQK